MSEAMTNSEIEDVLSSIRRLVAQESRASARPGDPRAGRERLVLTAEHRVDPGAGPRPQEPGAAAADEPQARPAPAAAAAPLAATLDELEAALAATPVAPVATGPAAEAAATAAPNAPAAAAEIDIDEADLQRLIARLVREELRGQLGEKITLQVRKLVRAEIARALDERNLAG